MKTSFDTIRSPALLVIGVVIAVLAVGCGSSTSSSSSAGGSGISSSTASSTATQPSSQAGGRSYDLPASARTLKIDNETGSLLVTAGQGSSPIHVVKQPTGSASSSRSVAGSVATIASRCPGGISLEDCHMDYEVTMPSSIRLIVNGSAGRISLKGGPANVQLKASAGEVSGSNLARGSYMVATGAGKVDLSFASPPTLVKVKTDAGEIDVTVPGNASYRVKASAPIGEENVAVPNDSTAANVIELSATVGSVFVHKG